MADLPPVAIVLAVGGAVMGGPEALRLLLTLEDRNAAADVAICAFLFCAFTAFLLEFLLLARFFRDADARPAVPSAGTPAPPPAPGTERLARVTLTVALAVMFVITTCLLVVPSNLAGTERGGVRSCAAA